VSDMVDSMFADRKGPAAAAERFEGALWRNIALLEKLRSPENCRAYLQEAARAGVEPEELRYELVRLAGIVLETNAMLIRAAGVSGTWRSRQASHAGEPTSPKASPVAFDWRNMASRMPLLATAALAIETAHELATRHPMAGRQSSVAGRPSLTDSASHRDGPLPT
jgi:hypothetical protein